MLLKKKIKGSSIAEVVIALTVIAICLGVASLIFVRSTNVTSRFMDVKKQTFIQSEILKHMYMQDLHTVEWDIEGVQVNEIPDENNDSLIVLEFISTDNKVIWKQQMMKE